MSPNFMLALFSQTVQKWLVSNSIEIYGEFIKIDKLLKPEETTLDS